MLNRVKLIRQKGFTLIELLVVITLIAILAVAVLATINPVEQRRKAIDTGMKATAAEYVNAQERYFAQYGCYTHDSSPSGVCPATTTTTSAAGGLTHDDYLLTQNEVKKSLLDRLNDSPYSTIEFTVDGNDEIHGSFLPQSQAFKPKGTFPADCDTSGSGSYYCVPDSVE